jgi:hypothetical protein
MPGMPKMLQMPPPMPKGGPPPKSK